MVTLIAGILIKVVQDYPDLSLCSPLSLTRSTNVTQHLHSPVVSHSSFSHPQSVTPKAASSIVSESFYWTALALLEALSLLYVPRLLV